MAVLEFDYRIIDENISAVFFPIVFNDDFSALLWELMLPIIVPFAHIVFVAVPIIKTLCSAFMSEMRSYGKRIFGANDNRLSADRTKILFLRVSIVYFDSFVRFVECNIVTGFILF